MNDTALREKSNNTLTRARSEKSQGSRSRTTSIPTQKTELTDFDLLKQIGKGGFGEVYLCKKKDTQEILALKIMDKTNIWAQNKLRSVMNERDVLAKGSYPSLVKLHYSFQDTKYLYLAMEFCPGGDLFHLMEDFTMLEIPEATLYMAEMIHAVQTLHNLGYIHRDLKPDNFLIDARGHLKLADFGLSKEGVREFSVASPCFINPTIRTCKGYSMVGSPDYMSPEVINAPVEGYGKEVDWWSLGCVFFDMICGYPPFSAETPDEVFDNIQNWTKTLPVAMELARPNFTEEFEEFLHLFLCKPEQRVSGNINTVKKHSIFTDINWNNLYEHSPFYVPKAVDFDDTSYLKTNVQTNSTLTPRKATNQTFQQYYAAKMFSKSQVQSQSISPYQSISCETDNPPNQTKIPAWATPRQKKDIPKVPRSSTIESHLVTPCRRGSTSSITEKQILGFSFRRTQTTLPRTPAVPTKVPQFSIEMDDEDGLFD